MLILAKHHFNLEYSEYGEDAKGVKKFMQFSHTARSRIPKLLPSEMLML